MDISTNELLLITYAINQAGSIKGLLFAASLALGSILFLTFMHFSIHNYGFPPKKYTIPIVSALLVTATLCALVPSKDSIMQIAAVYGVSELMRTETMANVGDSVSEVASKATAVINKKLDEELAK